MPRIEVAGDIWLRRPRPTQGCRSYYYFYYYSAICVEKPSDPTKKISEFFPPSGSIKELSSYDTRVSTTSQSPSRSWRSLSQSKRPALWNAKLHRRCHNSPPRVHRVNILNISPVFILISSSHVFLIHPIHATSPLHRTPNRYLWMGYL